MQQEMSFFGGDLDAAKDHDFRNGGAEFIQFILAPSPIVFGDDAGQAEFAGLSDEAKGFMTLSGE